MSGTRTRRGLIAGVAIALILLACAGPALAAVCPSQSGSYRVDVLIEMPPVTLHHDHSRAQLGLLAFHGPTDRVLGVTTSKLRAGTSTYYGNRPLEGEGVCFWVDRIEVMLRYEALDIYIASDYTRASCQYQAILTHEKRHAGVAQSYLDDYVQTIRSALASLAIPKPRDPRLVESVTEAQEKTQATIEKLLRPVITKLRKTMEKAQNRIDSAAEYRRVEKQCAKW
jgi:hypothetical protein